ncbi:hypothetical protein MUG78_17810 [Gordonia alkaliphila]|uniref:hypothetical protein n=1 Tax=Gordonia alkaliphila TaxID=1053547 RepID=UPI001FF61E43|nr:hypothetical protein [Gordonia alkaliphila]MCK0441258.1 hypothetical protein [Gordonia alkaliphila]
MKITILFTDVYDGKEFTRTETHDMTIAPDVNDPNHEDVEDWAEDNVFPHTGLGRSGEAGYFAKILSCEERPYLVGHEFTWGV